MGEFDESISNDFNIMFKFILFRFNVFISFLELFYFNCKLFYFRNKYFKVCVLEQKKGDLELIRAKNMKILDNFIRHGGACKFSKANTSQKHRHGPCL